MPTPYDVIFNPLSYTFFAIYAGLILLEFLFPARTLPKSPFWVVRGLTAFVIYFFIASYLPLFTDAWLSQFRIIDATALPLWAAVIAGLLVYELGLYCWHRFMHSSMLLWRVFHQMHHSAERIDSFGAFWFSPMDMVGFTLLVSLSLNLVIGLPAEAVVIILQITFVLAIVQHLNVKTPVWLGYIIQRPESHHLHHAKGVHYYNFSDLPVFDLLFGTFRNPRHYKYENGYYQGASLKLTDMLLFKDINPIKQPQVSVENSSGQG